MRRSRSRTRRALDYVLGFALFLLVWWGGSLVVGPGILPGPAAAASYLASGGVLQSFLTEFTRTLARAILGFSAAWVAAVPAGFVMGRFRAGDRIGFFPLFLLQGAPPLFWVTPLVLWLGTDGLVAPAVAFLISLPLLTAHVASAIRHIPEFKYDVFRIYAPRPRVIVRELYLPSLLPAVRSNIELGFLLSVKGAMLAEWFAAQNGFGTEIRIFYQFFAMTEFVSWAFLFLIVVGSISVGLRFALNRLLPPYRPTLTRDDGLRGEAPLFGPEHQPSHPSGGESATDNLASLSVHDLSSGYEGEAVFTGIDLTVRATMPVVVSGESGCGKTTLARCIVGLLPAWTGTISGPEHRALVFQSDALLEHRDAIGNVLLPSLPNPTRREVELAREALDRWGLADAERRFPHELSGGMRKRLSMARAWFHDPQALILDEPFVNLDREARAALWETLLDRLRDAPIPCLIITHYPEELPSEHVRRVIWDEIRHGKRR